MKVKICGITTPEDLLLADRAGADYAGIVLASGSKRQVSLERLRELGAVPFRLKRVGVVVLATPRQIARAILLGRLTVVQLYGCSFRQAGIEVWYATPGKHARHTIVLDAYPGLGRVGDWNHAARVARTRRMVLSGGLTPDNLDAAIQTVHPWCVDVSSGTEASPGHKDHQKVLAFIRKAKS